MCRNIKIENLFYVVVEDFEGETNERYMEADDIQKVKTYIKDNFLLDYLCYEITTASGNYLADGLISEI